VVRWSRHQWKLTSHKCVNCRTQNINYNRKSPVKSTTGLILPSCSITNLHVVSTLLAVLPRDQFRHISDSRLISAKWLMQHFVTCCLASTASTICGHVSPFQTINQHLDGHLQELDNNKQESPADAVKPARRKNMQKLLQFDVFRFISPNSISPNCQCIASRGYVKSGSRPILLYTVWNPVFANYKVSSLNYKYLVYRLFS